MVRDDLAKSHCVYYISMTLFSKRFCESDLHVSSRRNLAVHLRQVETVPRIFGGLHVRPLPSSSPFDEYLLSCPAPSGCVQIC